MYQKLQASQITDRQFLEIQPNHVGALQNLRMICEQLDLTHMHSSL
jgi:hypothetical protein